MISKIIGIGNKIEFTKTGSMEDENGLASVRSYMSKVYDIFDDTRMKVAMPIEGGHVVAISLNTKLNACFYTSKGLYQCRVAVVDRMKEGNIYSMVVEIVSELTKYQRRQYFRLGCTMDIHYLPLTKEEALEVLSEESIPEKLTDRIQKSGITLDISGGGVRFVSDEKFKVNDVILLKFSVIYGEKKRVFVLIGRVVSSECLQNRKGTYEHRIEFVSVAGDVRESLIKYIFEEERKQRQREKM